MVTVIDGHGGSAVAGSRGVSAQEPAASHSCSIPPYVRPPKLYGRRFYEAIGAPTVVLAPMVDQSEFVSR